MPPLQTDVLIIGGGAAGMMCAIEAGKRGRSVVVLEHAEKIGKKILISGGGRCNFTNIHARPECYLCANPHFARSALARYTPADFISLVEKHRIAYHEKKLGQLFCDESSRQIVGLLLKEAADAGVEICLGQTVERVEKMEKGRNFHVHTSTAVYETSSVVIASGGLSIPKMGATGLGHHLARQFGLSLIEPRPGLVPLTLSRDDLARLSGLSGISIDVTVSLAGRSQGGYEATPASDRLAVPGEPARGRSRRRNADVAPSFRENLLFTHRGLSGPAILQISSYWRPGQSIVIDLLPDLQGEKFVAELSGGMKTGNWLSQRLPRRFVESWLDSKLADRPVGQLSRAEAEALDFALHQWKIHPSGTEGYAKAEVTVGGVDTNFLSSKTMEAKNAPGLFFIGEAVDVTGWLGGYNFQWAWASGWVAGQYA